MNRMTLGGCLQAEEDLGAELSPLFVEMLWPEKNDSSKKSFYRVVKFLNVESKSSFLVLIVNNLD